MGMVINNPNVLNWPSIFLMSLFLSISLMAIFRKIHVHYWRDSFVEKLIPEQRYFYLYLMTNECSKQCGIYELTIKKMCNDTGYNTETVKKHLKFFIENNKIQYSEETEEIAIKNWLKYNDSSSPKVKACIEKELKEVKNRVLIEYLYSMDTHSQEEQEQEEEEEQEKEEESESPRFLWINIFTHNPGMVEVDFCKRLINQFGYKKAKTILYDLRRNNFHSVKTMEESLDAEGNIKQRENVSLLQKQEPAPAAHKYLD